MRELRVTELREGKPFLDQYVVERVVGNMGSCVLFKVRHARLGRRFLLKYLSPRASSEPHADHYFLQAAREAMRLRSEHAARTVDVGRLACGLPYLVTEAFEGSELREIVRVRGALGSRGSGRFRAAGSARRRGGPSSRDRAWQLEPFHAVRDARRGRAPGRQGVGVRERRNAARRSALAQASKLDSGHRDVLGIGTPLGHAGVFRARAGARFGGADSRGQRLGSRRDSLRALGWVTSLSRDEHDRAHGCDRRRFSACTPGALSRLAAGARGDRLRVSLEGTGGPLPIHPRACGGAASLCFPGDAADRHAHRAPRELRAAAGRLVELEPPARATERFPIGRSFRDARSRGRGSDPSCSRRSERVEAFSPALSSHERSLHETRARPARPRRP